MTNKNNKLKCFFGTECADQRNYIACFAPEAEESLYSFQELCSNVMDISNNIDRVDITAKEGRLNLSTKRNYGWENFEIDFK